MKNIKMKNLFALIFISSLMVISVQAQDTGPYWFFAKAALAKRKTIPASELTACTLGDTHNLSIRGKFKAEIRATSMNESRLLESGACDVALAFDDRPDGFERIKKDYRGFAIYKVSGDNLVLAAEPEAVGWIAVGRMELAAQQTLEKRNIAACGEGSLRDLFRPSPRTWKNWSNILVPFEDLKTQKDLERENALLYGCDVWIFSPENYKRFSSKYGTKYPLFDVTPDNPALTRKK